MTRKFPSRARKSHDETQNGKKRRGATSIEYVFMASLIIVVLIITIQHLGEIAQGIFTNNAEKTKVMDVSKK